MPRNPYISHGTRPEQDLLSDLLIESIKVYGHDVIYIPRKIVKMDNLLNEDLLSEFDESYTIEMYIESVDGFEGDGKLLGKFGLEVRDQITFVVARRQWNKLVSRFSQVIASNDSKPREGDLIYLPMTKGLFEIKYSDDKKPFYQLNTLPTFKLTCELFEYSSQKIKTGHTDVDKLQAAHAQTHRAYVEFEAPGDEVHIEGEMVGILLPSGITGTARFLKYATKEYPDEIIISLGNLTFNDEQFHQLTSGTVITGQDSNTVSTIITVIDLFDGDAEIFENDAFAQNSTFEVDASDIIDFSVANPFGEP